MSNINEPLAESWEKTLLPINATLQQAISNLNETGCRVIIITTPDLILVGTLTDGDIRRGLLRNMGMDSSIEPIVEREPLVAPPSLGRGAVLKLMQANKVHQLPIVDESRRVVGLHLLEDWLEPRQHSNLIIIMAGGQGTRLRPHTKNRPKAMLLINGKPMLEHIIERAKLDGFKNFVIAILHLGHMIEEYFGNGDRFKVEIKYIREKLPLGTAGALSLLKPRPDKPFVVTNGDVLTDINCGELLDFHNRQGAVATMAVRVHEWQHPFGVVQMQGVEVIGFEEKPISRNHINAGVYVLSPDALNDLVEDSPCDMPSLFERLHKKNKLTVAYPMHEPWLDVGRPDDLVKANLEKNNK